MFGQGVEDQYWSNQAHGGWVGGLRGVGRGSSALSESQYNMDDAVDIAGLNEENVEIVGSAPGVITTHFLVGVASSIVAGLVLFNVFGVRR